MKEELTVLREKGIVIRYKFQHSTEETMKRTEFPVAGCNVSYVLVEDPRKVRNLFGHNSDQFILVGRLGQTNCPCYGSTG